MMMTILEKAINSTQEADLAFCKFITANDAGTTGGHQAGFHIHKGVWPLFFDQAGTKGSNMDKFITIKWQDDFETSSRFIYYGVGTRNEYRLTRFGRGFPFLKEDNVGDLLILIKKSEDYYEGYVLNKDEDIEDFFAANNISSTETNQIIPKQFEQTSEEKLLKCFLRYVYSLDAEFPSTIDLATYARACYNEAHNISINQIIKNPDKEILNWVEAEFKLFKTIEEVNYLSIIQNKFESVEQLVKTANSILNRRKSRAGRSLEHHLEEIFKVFELSFQTQTIIEGNKKPDFLFPGLEAYNDPKYNDEKLIFLASKTTCKDRWRQVLNEADRIKTKHLFTLQQGISKNQMGEMSKYGVRLVVPKAYISSFPMEFRSDITSLEAFIQMVKYVHST